MVYDPRTGGRPIGAQRAMRTPARPLPRGTGMSEGDNQAGFQNTVDASALSDADASSRLAAAQASDRGTMSDDIAPRARAGSPMAGGAPLTEPPSGLGGRARMAAAKAMRRAPTGDPVSSPTADDLNAAVLKKLAMEKADTPPLGSVSAQRSLASAMAARDVQPPGMKRGGQVKNYPGRYAKGGLISRGDGMAKRGKTKGRHC